MTSGPQEDWLLGDVKDWLRDRVDGGAKCPCCTQLAKVYRRHINGEMVRALAALYVRRYDNHNGYVHLPTIHPTRADSAKLVYWNLIEEEPVYRSDNGRAGWWRITSKGMEWLQGGSFVQKYARIYDGKLLGLEGGPWYVHDAVKDKFDLRELMER
jgi:hypothetical protein